MPELTLAQVQDLVRRHKLKWTPEQVRQLMAMLGGHPYLVRVALYKIARGQITLEQLLKIAHLEEGPYYDHLRHHLLSLQEYPDLVVTLKNIVTANSPIAEKEVASVYKLHNMGLVKIQNNTVMPSCELYRLYFRSRL